MDMAENQASFLSPSQKRIIAAGGTALAAVFLAATCYYLFILLREFVTHFKDVLLPLAIAAILATLLRPIISFCEKRTRLNRVGGIILLFVLVILTCGAIAAFVVPPALHTAGEFLKIAPDLLQKFLTWVEGLAPSIWEWLTIQLGESPSDYLMKSLEGNTELIKQTLTHAQSSAGVLLLFMGGIFGKIAAYSIIPVYLFFILNNDSNVWKKLEGQLSFLPDGRREDLVFLAKQFSDILVSFFRGQIIIGLLLGLVLAIGFGIVGLKFGIMLGFVLGLLNIIPYLGTCLLYTSDAADD